MRRKLLVALVVLVALWIALARMGVVGAAGEQRSAPLAHAQHTVETSAADGDRSDAINWRGLRYVPLPPYLAFFAGVMLMIGVAALGFRASESEKDHAPRRR